MKFPSRLASVALIGALALGGVACNGDTETDIVDDTSPAEETPADDTEETPAEDGS